MTNDQHTDAYCRTGHRNEAFSLCKNKIYTKEKLLYEHKTKDMKSKQRFEIDIYWLKSKQTLTPKSEITGISIPEWTKSMVIEFNWYKATISSQTFDEQTETRYFEQIMNEKKSMDSNSIVSKAINFSQTIKKKKKLWARN